MTDKLQKKNWKVAYHKYCWEFKVRYYNIESLVSSHAFCIQKPFKVPKLAVRCHQVRENQNFP